MMKLKAAAVMARPVVVIGGGFALNYRAE